jgi:hypothetical protein
MALVAGLTVGSVPILIGSLQVTQLPAAAPATPTSNGDSSAPPALPRSEFRIRQRLTLVNDYLAVAWSGPLPAATFVIKQLRKLAADKPIPANLLESFVKSVQQDRHLSQLALIGIRVETADRAVLFGWGVQRGELTARRWQYLCESSAHDYFRLAAEQFVELLSNGDSLLRSISIANALASAFLVRQDGVDKQIRSGATSPLLVLQGGGYETVVLHHGRLRKVPTLFNFWHARLEDKWTGVDAPTLVIKRDYTDGKLLLRWGWAKPFGKQIILPVEQQQCLVVSEADDFAEPEGLQSTRWPSYHSDIECHEIFVTDAEGLRISTLTHQCTSELDRDIRFAEQPDGAWTRGRLAMATPSKIIAAANRLRDDPKNAAQL